MKIYFIKSLRYIYAFIILILVLSGCVGERTYEYPGLVNVELHRICRSVGLRNTNRFMVIDSKVYPLNKDGYTAPLEEITTSLEEAGYFCGPIRSRELPCTPGKNKTLSGKICSFSK